MFVRKPQDQGTIVLSQQDYLPILVKSFLVDRRSPGLSPDTVSFYRKKISYFLTFCEAQAVTQVSQVTPDLIRRFMLELAGTHNAGGTHACFRPLRTFLSLQRLMGHADLQVLRRYLAQTDADDQEAHMRGSPVDRNL